MDKMYSFLSESILIQEDAAARDAKRAVENAIKKFKKFKGEAPARNAGESNADYAKRLNSEYAKTKKGNPSGSKPNPQGTSDYKKATAQSRAEAKAAAEKSAARARAGEQLQQKVNHAKRQKDIEAAFKDSTTKQAVPVGKVEPVKKVASAGDAARQAKKKSTALVPTGKRNEHKVANAGKKALAHLSKHKGKYAVGTAAAGLAGYGIYKWAKNKKAAAKKDK